MGVSKLISFGPNLPAPVPQDLINSLRLRCDDNIALLPLDDLAAGACVKILSGSFSEFNGEIETLLPGDCSRLLLELLEATGANVVFHDPHVPVIPMTREHAELAGRASVEAANAKSADAALIVANHDSVDYQKLADEAGLIIDTRNAMHGIHGTAQVVKA